MWLLSYVIIKSSNWKPPISIVKNLRKKPSQKIVKIHTKMRKTKLTVGCWWGSCWGRWYLLNSSLTLEFAVRLAIEYLLLDCWCCACEAANEAAMAETLKIHEKINREKNMWKNPWKKFVMLLQIYEISFSTGKLLTNKIILFSNFACMFLNPNNFFLFEF